MLVRHRVGARSTIKNVVGAVTLERVVEARAGQILNTDQRVAWASPPLPVPVAKLTVTPEDEAA